MKPLDWFFCLWFTFSVCFLTTFYALFRDEILSKTESGLIALLALASIPAAILFLILFQTKPLLKITLFCLSAFCGLLITFFSPHFPAGSFSLIQNYELEILEMDEGTEVELVWAYWADFPEKSDAEIIDYRHYRDISYEQFEKNGDWNISEEGFLASAEKHASLRLNVNRIHFHLPVLCINAKNGRALVAETYNGQTNFYTLNGTDADAMPTSGFRHSFVQSILAKIIAGLAVGGVLVLIFLPVGKLFERLAKKFQTASPLRKNRTDHAANWLILTAAFAAPVFLMLAVCAMLKVYPFGTGTFLRVDMNSQYVDFLAYLRSIVFSENDFFYSFSKNLGGDMYSLAAYYLGNPINFLVCLFPQEDLPKAVSFLILLRIGLCGLTANLYLRKIGKAGPASVIFSTAYAMMSYNMMNVENIFFIDGVIFLPLVALGIEKLVEEDSPFCYIISLAAIMMINFYMGFMICIFSVLYFGYRLLTKYDIQSIPQAKKPVWTFLAGSLLAAGIAAIVLIPVVKQLGSGPKYLDPSRMTGADNFSLFDIFSKNISGAYDSNEYKHGIPTIYSGAIVTAFLALFFRNRNIGQKEKWLTAGLLGIFLMSFQINSLNLVWHGFSEPNWWPFRNAFIFSFFMILIAWKSFIRRDVIEPSDIRIAFILITAGLILCEKFGYPYLTTGHIYFEIFLIGSICLLLFLENRAAKTGTKPQAKIAVFLFLLISLGNLLHNAHSILKLNLAESVPLTEFAEATGPTDAVITEIRAMDDGFYRQEKQYHRTENDAMRNATSGVTHYSSTTRQDELNFLSRIGINHLYYWTRYGEGSTIAVDSLLGIRYLLSKSETLAKPYSEIFSKNGIHVYRNPFALPIAFLVSADLVYNPSWEDDPFAFQNRLFESLRSEQTGTIFTPAAVERTTDPVSNNETWTVTIDTTETLYVYFFSPMQRPESVILNGDVSLMDRFAANRIGVVPLGSFQPGDVISMAFDRKKDDSSKLTPLIYYENTEIIAAYFQQLDRHPVDLDMISSSYLTGTFTSESDEQYAFFSIPYDEGWHISIDGEATRPVRVLSDLMGVKVPKGMHRIEMKYRPQGFKAGMGISAFSVVLFMAGGLAYKQKNTPQAG